MKMLRTMNKMENQSLQNQKIKKQNSNPFNKLDKLVSSNKQNDKFKNILDGENKVNSNKLKNNVDKNINDKKEVHSKKEVKKVDKKEDEIKDEIKDKSKKISDEVLVLLSQLLDIPLDELKDMNLETLSEALEIELDLNLEMELGLDALEELNVAQLLSETNIENIGLENVEGFMSKLNDKLSIKIDNDLENKKLIDLSEILVEDLDNKSKENLNEIDKMGLDVIMLEDESKGAINENFNDENSLDDSDENVESKTNNRKLNSKKINNTEEITTEKSEVDSDIKLNDFGFDNIVRRNDKLFVNHEDTVVRDFETIDQDDVIKQVLNNMEFDLSDGKNEVKINLKPNELGEMVMKLEVTKGEVAARITVENYKTKEILEANILTLQEELEETGMEIKSFEVFVGQDSDFQRDGSERFNFFNQSNQFKKKNNKQRLGNISSNYEMGTVEDIEPENKGIIDGNMDFLV